MKTTLKKAIQDEGGAALVLTLVLLMIGGLIMAPLFGHIGTGHIAGQVHEARMEQLYTADAGVEDAIWRMTTGEISAPVACEDPEEWSYNITVNGAFVDIWVEYVENDTFRVISTTNGGDSATSIESYVFWGSHWQDLLDYGVIALAGDINITGSSVLDSSPDKNQTNIYANGNIQITGSAQVRGSATATGAISDARKVDPGPVNDFHPQIAFELPVLSIYLNEAKRGEFIDVSAYPDNELVIDTSRDIGPAYINGDLHLTSKAILTLKGPVWVEGNVITDAQTRVRGKAPLVAEGNIYMAGGAALDTEEMPVIISTVDDQALGLAYAISFEGGADAYMVLYAPNGLIEVKGSGAVNGAIIGKRVDISIAARVTAVYDLDVVNRVRAKEIRILTWEVDTQ